MPWQRAVVDLVYTVVKGLEHLGIKQTYQKIIGIVIVRDNSVQGAFLFPQRVQIHIVVVRDGPIWGRLKGARRTAVDTRILLEVLPAAILKTLYCRTATLSASPVQWR